MATDNSPKELRRAITTLEGELRRLLRDAPWKRRATVSPQNAPKRIADPTDGHQPAEIEASPTPGTAKRSDYRWYKSIEKWKTVFEIVAIPFAIGYAVVAYCQWSDSNKSFRIDQRAWMHVAIDRSKPFEMVAGNTISVFVSVINSGKTPARSLAGKLALSLVKNGDEPDFTDAPSGSPGNGFGYSIFYSGQIERPQEVTALAIANDRFLIPTQSQIEQINRGSLRLIFHGRIEYDDIFRKHHWFTYCEYLRPVGGPDASGREQKICTDRTNVDDNN